MSRINPKARVRAKAIRYAVTGVLTAGLLAGCAGSKHMARAGDHAVRANAQHEKAVDAAEAVVARNPETAAARAALGQTYLEAGRFRSAATTFGDAVELGDTSGRTQLSLALAQIGSGDARSAVELLDEARDTIPASDRGLALALAGQPGRGVAILMDALREGENSPKLRQNLAFAYALDGRWREARMAMAQDVPADRIDDRISQWALMSRPEDVQRRVASLLSVPFGVDDAGQPVELALGSVPQAEQFAAAEAVMPEAVGSETVAAVPQMAAATELPPIDDSAPVFAAPPSIAAPAAKSAPVVSSFATAFAAPAVVAQPVVQTIPAPRAYRSVKTERAPVASTIVAHPTHAVQLGSFSSEANARRAIGIFTARNPELRDFEMKITPAVVDGKNFWRVAATGFDRRSARSLCAGVKSGGGACFAYAATNAPAGARPALAFAVAAPKAR